MSTDDKIPEDSSVTTDDNVIPFPRCRQIEVPDPPADPRPIDLDKLRERLDQLRGEAGDRD